MKPENITNNNIKVIGLIDVMTDMLNNYKADREVNFYVKRVSINRIYSGRMSDITFGDLVKALAISGYDTVRDLTSVKCRVTTLDDDRIVITIL